MTCPHHWQSAVTIGHFIKHMCLECERAWFDAPINPWERLKVKKLGGKL